MQLPQGIPCARSGRAGTEARRSRWGLSPATSLPAAPPSPPRESSRSRPCSPVGTGGTGGGSRKEGTEGEVSRGVPGRGEDSHESAERAQCDFIASREEAPGAGGRSECSSRSGRSEAPAACAGQGAGQSSGLARSLGAGVARGGRARARKAPGRGADLSSPPPPSRSPVPASARDAAQRAFRLQVALQRRPGRTAGGRGWSSAPAGIPGLEGARAQNGGAGGRRGKGGRGRQNLHCPSGPALQPKRRESPEIRPAALAPRRGAGSCVLLNSHLGHLPGPAELGAAHLQQRDCGLGAVFPLRGWRS